MERNRRYGNLHPQPSAGVRRGRRHGDAAGENDMTRAPDEAQSGARDLIRQAERDITRGLRDTDLHGVPSNVPGPGPDPEQTPGASVPPDGVDVPARKR